MPFYEYQCNICGHTLEAKPQLQRLMSAPVFRLKGGGWYETDFKSDQDAKRNLADRPEVQAPKEEKKETTEAQSKEAAPPKAAAREPAPKTQPARRAHVTAANKSKSKAAAKRPTRPAAKRTAAK